MRNWAECGERSKDISTVAKDNDVKRVHRQMVKDLCDIIQMDSDDEFMMTKDIMKFAPVFLYICDWADDVRRDILI
jgi:hypothetical protein